MEANDLNKLLTGRTILGVEEGTTPGWIVINLSTTDADPEGAKVFMTAYCGGRKGYNNESAHYSTVALHAKFPSGNGHVEMIRDSRDPEQPIASPGGCGAKESLATEANSRSH
jgi:hypothetical protein